MGNVLATVLDRKTGYGSLNGEYTGFKADIASATDYYPFGMEMPGRTFSSENSRFGFNGQEKDNEVKGNGSSINYQARIYDTRLSRFLSVDPLTAHFPWYTPYQFAGNTPIQAIDLDGAEEYHYTRIKKGGKTTSLKLTHTKDLYEWVWAPNWDKKTLWTKVKNKSQSYVVHQMQERVISSDGGLKYFNEDESVEFNSYDKALKSTDADFANTFEDWVNRFVQGSVNVRDEARQGRIYGAKLVDLRAAMNRVAGRVSSIRDRNSGSFRAYFFGSRNNGTNRSNSDLDLLIITDNTDFFKSGNRGGNIIKSIQADYKKSTGLDLDVNVMTTQQYNRTDGGNFRRSVDANKTEIKVK
ncbi:MAG: hypothetical protein BGO31_07930 [Bacteroidetes bacterium 43-16]|nr:MAG: hypothetical protein BGO31_07930 [Bacteroidetes bacterium 43-16]